MEALVKSKLMTLSDAVARHVSDGDTVYLAGFTHLIPFAVAHEIIRQRRRNLTLARATPDLIYEQMIAAGCARKLIFSWAGNPGVGLLRVFRRASERGELEIEEYTHYQMVARLAAGAANLPFYPVRSGMGTDLPKVNPLIKQIEDPYGGRPLMTVPALKPDVTVIHAQRADLEGNAHIWGIVGEQKEAAFAAERVILTTEEIVSSDVIRSDPNRVLIPGFKVDAVVELPWCAHPSYAQGYYDRDNVFYLEWDAISSDQTRLETWLAEHVFGLENHAQYVEKLGLKASDRLRVAPKFAAAVNYGAYDRPTEGV